MLGSLNMSKTLENQGYSEKEICKLVLEAVK